MTEYLTVPGTAKNPSALKKFTTAEVSKVSDQLHKVRGGCLRADQSSTNQTTHN